MLSHRVKTLGHLQCHLLAGDLEAMPRRCLVLCHGFGAPGTDLVPMAFELCQRAPRLTSETLFVFPEAPLSPPEFRAFGGRAWWPLDLVRLQSAIAAGEFRDLRRDVPERLPAAREELTSVLAALESDLQVPTSLTLVGGFSQGSMLATDVVLRLPLAPAGLVIYSGTLLNETEWRQLAPQKRGLRVLQSHGLDDPILPFSAAESLRDLLTEAGIDVEFQRFRGGHTIPGDALSATARRLESIGSAP